MNKAIELKFYKINNQFKVNLFDTQLISFIFKYFLKYRKIWKNDISKCLKVKKKLIEIFQKIKNL